MSRNSKRNTLVGLILTATAILTPVSQILTPKLTLLAYPAKMIPITRLLPARLTLWLGQRMEAGAK
mgnify:CR=1 FL=1